jgi:type I restriction enzyme M protein
MPANGHVAFIYSIAQRLRGAYKQSEYGRVILPFTLLRRLDQVLEPTKNAVLAEAAKRKGSALNPDRMLKQAAGQRFYNTSSLTLTAVHSDSENVAKHLKEYVGHFDPVVRDIFSAFEFDATITRLNKAQRLYPVLSKFLDPELDLHPDVVPPERMGDIFEELIRRFSEISNATAGEHFTPREVVRLCVELGLAGDESLTTPGIVRSVYDPACGTGGMLSVTDEVVRERNPKARLVLFGQELNPESWAVCRAEMLLKDQDPSRIAAGSTLSEDGAKNRTFDFMLANPPFGVDWADDYDDVVDEHETQGMHGRFGAALPRKSDGALLFLQNMLAKMKDPADGGSRIVIIFNASPLFAGDAGAGESEIRRWILEQQDWLEAIVALPEQLFYNTPISTYLWVLSNRKEDRRQDKVQLIDARDMWEPMTPRSFGQKRRRLSEEDIHDVLDLWREFDIDGERSKVFPTSYFGYRQIPVERPLRLRYRAGEDAVEALEQQTAFRRMAPEVQEQLKALLRSLNGLDTTSRADADAAVEAAATERLRAPAKRALSSALGVRDQSGDVVHDRAGEPTPDPDLREYELVPLNETVEEYFDRQVKPFLPDAWVSDYEGKMGYELPFTRIFYRYQAPRSLAEVDRELQDLERAVEELLDEVTE